MWPAEKLIDVLYRATNAQALLALQELQTETHEMARSKNVLDTFTPINEIVTALTETCEDCVQEIARRMQLIKSEYENYTINHNKSYLIDELFRVVCGLIVALPSPNRNIREQLEALAIYGKKPTTKTAIRLLEYARQITPSMDTYWVAQAHFPPAKGASVEVNVTPQRWEKHESMPLYKTDGWHSATVSRVDDRTVELTFLDDSEHGSTRENFQIGDFAPNKLVEVKMKEEPDDVDDEEESEVEEEEIKMKKEPDDMDDEEDSEVEVEEEESDDSDWHGAHYFHKQINSPDHSDSE